MLGLADRGRIRDLLETLLAGDAGGMLARLDEAHALGVEPTALLRGLMETLHAVSRAKAGAAGDVLASAEERAAAADLSAKLGWAPLHRLWQMLLKGLSDVQIAPDPAEAATMALLRIIHAADLPDPATVLARLAGGEGTSVAVPAARAAAPAAPAASAARVASFAQLVEALEKDGKALLALKLRDQVGLVRLEGQSLTIRPLKPLGPDFGRDLAAALKAATGTTFVVMLSEAESEPSLHEQERIAQERVRAEILAEPNVAAVLAAIPGASLESVTSKGAPHAQLR
jgi:DNA polymerase-3 subunit gamma/tau